MAEPPWSLSNTARNGKLLAVTSRTCLTRPEEVTSGCGPSQSNEKRKAMIDHIYLPVSDLERSSEFYKKMLEPLGIDMPYKFDQVPQRGFAINNIPGFWLKNGEVAKDLYV